VKKDEKWAAPRSELYFTGLRGRVPRCPGEPCRLSSTPLAGAGHATGLGPGVTTGAPTSTFNSFHGRA
jgi:hypothetical protein